MTRRLSCCPPPGGAYGSARFILAAGLVFLLSLGVILWMASSMAGGMDMPGGWRMSMMWMRMPGQSWAGSAGMFLFMWWVMMVAMMLPSLFPKLLRFYQSLVWKKADHPGLSTLLVGLGYFAVWSLVGAGVYGLGIPWALAAMRWPALSRLVPLLTGILILLAGAFQFSPWKSGGLNQCRDLLVFAPYGRRQKGVRLLKTEAFQACFMEGVGQGWSCALCCAGSMAVLLALGAMNFFVMLAVAAVIALEKLLSKPLPVVYLTGALAVAAGAIEVARTLF